MQVYEKRPSGLGPELGRHARTDRTGAAFALARVVVGILLMGLLTFPLGWLWFTLGVVSFASGFLFVRAAARAALVRPALVLTGRPKWDGTRRSAWRVESDDLPATLMHLTEGLDAECGSALTAYDLGDDYRGITRTEAFGSPEHPVLFAWGIDSPARLKANDDAMGIWLRMDYDDANELRATVLANEGRAVERLTHVAWRV